MAQEVSGEVELPFELGVGRELHFVAFGGEGLDGVAIYNPDARLIGRILLPERCANLCFGGVKRNRLFLAGSQSLYSIFVNTQGVAGG